MLSVLTTQAPRLRLHEELTDGEPGAEHACEGNGSCKSHYEPAALLAVLSTDRPLQMLDLDCHGLLYICRPFVSQ